MLTNIILILFGFIGGYMIACYRFYDSHVKITKRIDKLVARQNILENLPKDIVELRSLYELMLTRQYQMLMELHQNPNRVPPSLINLQKEFYKHIKEKDESEE